MSVIAASLGFPRIGLKRELKHALEAYWAGRSSEAELLAVGAELRARHWRLQHESGLDHIPSNDFSLYDQVLDWSCLVGCIPERFGHAGDTADLATYFSMARGRQDATGELVPLELSKWFDTNYHYLVPEFAPEQNFQLAGSKIFDEYREARALGIDARPVLLGPLTFVRLGKKQAGADYCRSTLIAKLLPVYVEILRRLEGLGARWVQIDEPALALDLPERYAAACSEFYRALCAAVPDVSILLATYFETLRDNTNLTFSLPVAGVHVDLCRGPGQANTGANAEPQALLAGYLERAQGKVLSLGVVDGRNVWRNDLAASLRLIETAVTRLGADRVCVAPSCSLLHVPVDLAAETGFDAEVRGWLAFAVQKLKEVVTLARGANRGRGAIAERLAASEAARAARHSSPRVRDEAVQRRLAAISPSMLRRRSPYAERRRVQREKLRLPLLPTTTIGSFPQTREIRAARAAYKRGELGAAQYRVAMQQEIRAVLDYQLEVGLDVLVHGEAERNDMVEYFGEQLAGFAFTGNGWVQSYGSRCVKPPILYGDVSRPRPMTVEWTQYAQRLTDRPVKGMLTGPITLLQWSFVRDDQPRRLTARQLALAVRDEVVDLERAGIRIVQIDEAALREGLPLRRADWRAYLEAAVEDFRLASSGVQDHTQIHTHMCYSEFNDIVESIAALDADVISIETSRSRMELLAAFARFKYPNEIGPGVYDIHSPRVPEVEEMFALLRRAAEVLAPEQLWVNPDCGLKTRGWAEVEPALKNMVAAARRVRAELSG